MKELGKMFFEARNKNKWSLGQVKIKIDSLLPKKDFSISEISKLEQGERKSPNPILLSKLCKIYGINDVNLFRNIGFLCKEDQKEIELYDKITHINIFDNIVDAMDSLVSENTKSARFLLFDKEFIDNSFNLVGLFLKNEDIPDELLNTEWVFINKGAEVSNGEIGVFLYQDKYLIRKKVISTDGGVTLIGKDNEITVVRNVTQYKELGKIIKGLKSF